MSTKHAARVRVVAAALIAAAAVGVALLAPRGPGGVAHARQKDAAWPKMADPLFPKSDKDSATGYAACAACHANTPPINEKLNVFAKNFKSHEFVLLTEGGTWLTEDPHSAATKVLERPLGKQMSAILKYDVTKAPQCLTCHATDKYPGMAIPKDVSIKDRFDVEHDKDGKLKQAEGVTCNACHGVRTDWQGAHYAGAGGVIAWRTMKPEDKEEKGMRNMRDPVVKAKMCATCHVGDPDTFRVVTHDMYAAGHPPLPPFELASFMNCEPMHWGAPSAGKLNFFTEAAFAKYVGEDVAKKDPNWMWNLFRTHPEAKEVAAARHLAAGAIASLHAEMRLIAADAQAVLDAKDKDDGPGTLDYARFDCYACHHDLVSPSPRQQRGYKWAPGRAPLKAWTAALPGIVAQHAGGLEPFKGVAAGFGDKWNAAQAAATVRPFGRPKDLAPAAREMAAWCEAFMKKDQAEANPIYTKAEAAKLLAAIGKGAVTDWSADTEAAMHLTWAFVALRSGAYGKADPKELEALAAVIPIQVRQPRLDGDKPTFSNKDGDPMTVGDTLKERLDLFNAFSKDKFGKAFGALNGK